MTAPPHVWRRVVPIAAVAIAACGPKPTTSWVEYDRTGQSHDIADHHEATRGAPTVAGSSSKFERYTPAMIDLPPHSLVGSAARPGEAGAIDSLDGAAARAAIEQLAGRAPAARIALRAARLAHHIGDDAEARALIARAAIAADEPELHAALVALGAELRVAAVDEAKIAVLLPLSGRFAAVGAELRAAIELAPARGTTWVFLDTSGESEGAVAAVEQALAKGAVAALGPVGTREVSAAARAAAYRGLPVAVLAPGDGADPSAGVFRVVSSPSAEARAVAALAHAQNFPTVAVLAPRDDVGQDAAEAFVVEAQRLGLTIAAAGGYDPTGGDVERDVKRFLNLVPATNPRLADHLRSHGDKGWRTFSPDVAFSLLYIPDRYDRAAIVAAFLPYLGVELRTTEFSDPVALRRKHGGHVPQVVQLVGGAGWNHPSLPIRGGSAVQGAQIVDVFAGARGGDVAAQFVADFQRKTGRPPSSAAAEAYDAATLVATARADMSAATPDRRSAYRAALATARLDDGACGPATISRAGELVRAAAILEVDGDELKLVQ